MPFNPGDTLKVDVNFVNSTIFPVRIVFGCKLSEAISSVNFERFCYDKSGLRSVHGRRRRLFVFPATTMNHQDITVSMTLCFFSRSLSLSHSLFTTTLCSFL